MMHDRLMNYILAGQKKRDPPRSTLITEPNDRRNPPTTPPPSARKDFGKTRMISQKEYARQEAEMQTDAIQMKIDIINIDKKRDTLIIKMPKNSGEVKKEETAKAAQMYMAGSIGLLVIPYDAKISIIRNEERVKRDHNTKKALEMCDPHKDTDLTKRMVENMPAVKPLLIKPAGTTEGMQKELTNDES